MDLHVDGKASAHKSTPQVAMYIILHLLPLREFIVGEASGSFFRLNESLDLPKQITPDTVGILFARTVQGIRRTIGLYSKENRISDPAQARNSRL